MQATTSAAQGSAETDYNLAGFSVALSAEGKTAPEAKAELKKQVDQLVTAIDAMKTKLSLDFVKNSVQTSTNVREQHEWNQKKNKNEFTGFLASYTYSFQISDLDQVSAVYDTLSSLPEATTSSPHFSIKDSTRDRVNKKALKDAFRKVQERFEAECEVLGLNPSDFEIASWEATYSDSRRSDRVAGAMRAKAARAMTLSVSNDDDLGELESAVACAPSGGGAPEPLEIVIGKAKVTANLEVGYAKRAVTTQTVKAEVVAKKSETAHLPQHA